MESKSDLQIKLYEINVLLEHYKQEYERYKDLARNFVLQEPNDMKLELKEPESPARPCRWGYRRSDNNEDYYMTECDQTKFWDDTSNYRFCPRCGRKIKKK